MEGKEGSSAGRAAGRVSDRTLHLSYKESFGRRAIDNAQVRLRGFGGPSRIKSPICRRLYYDRAGTVGASRLRRDAKPNAPKNCTLCSPRGYQARILVAHSNGGFNVRCFARDSPGQTAELLSRYTRRIGVLATEVLTFCARLSSPKGG